MHWETSRMISPALPAYDLHGRNGTFALEGGVGLLQAVGVQAAYQIAVQAAWAVRLRDTMEREDSGRIGVDGIGCARHVKSLQLQAPRAVYIVTKAVVDRTPESHLTSFILCLHPLQLSLLHSSDCMGSHPPGKRTQARVV